MRGASGIRPRGSRLRLPQYAAIAARRGGLFELQAENGVFLLRLALPLNG